MVDNQHKLIKGYKDLSQKEIDHINLIKTAEEELGKLWGNTFDNESLFPNGRWMNIARTHFEEGFSAFIRAIAKPEERF